MKAVISGAGIAGLAMAQRLRTIGWDVVLIEQAPGPRTQGYMMDIFGLGYEAAELIGVLPRMHELAAAVEELVYVDEAGRRRAALRYEGFKAMAGGRMLSIMRPALEQALRELVADHVELRFGRTITEIHDRASAVRVVLDDSAAIEADLLVGADGIHSNVRRLLFGPEELFLLHLGFHTAAFTFDDPRLRQRVGERFILTDTLGRQMGFYGLHGDRVAAFAVHRTSERTLPEDARAALRERYAGMGWIVPDVLEQIPPDVYYDHVAQVDVPEWWRGRVVLLGDAGGAVSLLAGQGASLAMAGACVLGDLLASADTVEAALAMYEKRWRPVVADRQATARRGTRWFLPRSRFQRWLRRQALALSRIPALARWFGGGLVGKPGVTIAELAAAPSHEDAKALV